MRTYVEHSKFGRVFDRIFGYVRSVDFDVDRMFEVNWLTSLARFPAKGGIFLENSLLPPFLSVLVGPAESSRQELFVSQFWHNSVHQNEKFRRRSAVHATIKALGASAEGICVDHRGAVVVS